MDRHEAYRWRKSSEEEEWPQDLNVWPLNDPDGFHRGQWSLKDKATKALYTTNEQMTELAHRNERTRMD